MEETNWWHYLSDLMGNDTPTVAARKAEISASNFTRWKQGARADPDFVVKIARAYNGNVLEALVAADFITPEEAGEGGNSIDNELRHALKIVQLHGSEMDAIASEMYRELERVKGLPSVNDELAARRSNKTAGDVVSGSYDGTVQEWDPSVPHAADGSIDEQAEREKRGEDPID